MAEAVRSKERKFKKVKSKRDKQSSLTKELLTAENSETCAAAGPALAAARSEVASATDVVKPSEEFEISDFSKTSVAENIPNVITPSSDAEVGHSEDKKSTASDVRESVEGPVLDMNASEVEAVKDMAENVHYETLPLQVPMEPISGNDEGGCEETEKSTVDLLKEFNESIADAMTIAASITQDVHATISDVKVCETMVNEEFSVSCEDVSKPKELNYHELHQTLHNLIEEQATIPTYQEMVAASAPSVEESSQSETQLMDGRCRAPIQHKKISKIASCEKELIVRPFTEAQLKALYYNGELEVNELYVQDFIAKYQHTQSHEFYELLLGYLRSRTELISSTKAIAELRRDYEYKMEHVWSDVKQTAKAKGKCLDGKPVVGSYEYFKVNFNKQTAKELKVVLRAIQSKVHETYALHAYAVEMSKLQIEAYLCRLIAASPVLSSIPRNAPVQVYFANLRPPELSEHVEKILCCISILFTFQRRSIKDQQFVLDTRIWLNKLIAIILRVGSFEDHLFILNHVMRCPAGIENWAASFIQIPLPVVNQGPYPVGGPFLDHIMTVLSTLLLPVRAREDFLRELQVIMSSSTSAGREDNVWILVDSEGEEDEDPNNCWLHWRENDLVAILNQIPIGPLFQHLLAVFTINDVDYYDIAHLTDQEMMRVFSVATHLIYLLREGFKTFNLGRYRQFAKRISQLIRHIVVYVTDHIQHFIHAQPGLSDLVQHRLHVEYDQLFLRAAYSIFSSQRLGAWQFMAAMPYTWVSVDMLWKILWLLHNDYQENLEIVEQELPTSEWQKKLCDSHLHLKFEERLSQMPENEAYYLLTAFANMAVSRKSEDQDFIETVCREIFQISFINKHTKTTCIKWGRDLLGSIALKHPFVISMLVNEVADNVEQIGRTAVFLFQGIPTNLWQPTDDDTQMLLRWLKDYPPALTENLLAQVILSNMNWELNESGDKLFLNIALHRQIAINVVDAHKKHISLVKGSFISESIKQAASVLSTGMSPEETFNAWAWEMILSLKLHQNQMSSLVAQSSNFGPTPDLMQDLNMQDLKWSVKEKHPMAVFVAFSMTNFGHSIADFCQMLDKLQRLLDCHYFEAVLQVLSNVTPQFFHCGHYLWTSKMFNMLIQNLLNADITYLKMAKNLVISTYPGQILLLFSSMIENQMQSSVEMGWNKIIVATFWLEALTVFPQWYKNESILYLIDRFLMGILFENSVAVLSLLKTKFLSELCHQGATNTFSSFVSWMTTGAGIPFTLLQKNIGSKFAWLAYSLLEVETQNEQQQKMWKFVLKELSDNPKATLDTVVKKSAGADMIAPPVFYLPVYRWAQLCLEVANDHPLLPLIWQRFFTFYLQRAPYQPGGRDSGSVGLTFFSNSSDVTFMKKLKRKLEELIVCHNKLLLATQAEVAKLQDSNIFGEEPDRCISPLNGEWDSLQVTELFHEKLKGLYRTFHLWLEEPTLHDPNLYLRALLADYDPNRLALIIQNNQEPWQEFLNREKIKHDREKLVGEWEKRGLQIHKRPFMTPAMHGPVINDVQNMLKRMRSYEEPLPAPTVAPFKPVVPPLPSNIFDSGRSIRDDLGPYLSVLTVYASVYSQRLSNHAALDCVYLELLPQLYRNVDMEVALQVPCTKGLTSFALGSDSGCMGPATITLQFKEKKLIASAQTKLEQNRAEWLCVLNEALLGPPLNVCSAAVFVETAVSELLKSYRAHTIENVSAKATKLREVGLNIFYHLCGLMNADSELYPPARQFIMSSIEILGQELVGTQGDQCEQILQLVLDNPRQIGLLAPHFSPNMCGIPTFIKLYRSMITIHRQHGIHFTFVMLSKFDITQWLCCARPKLSERALVLDAIKSALFSFGVEPLEELEILNELYRHHLCKLLLHQFPDMYGDILVLLFQGMEEHTVCLNVWYDVLNALINNEDTPLSNVSLSNISSLEDVTAACVEFAEKQELLSLQQIQDTMDNLGKRFMTQRRSSNETLYHTHYTKYKGYVKPFSVFLGLMGHAYVFSLKQGSTGALPQSVIHQFWDVLKGTFSSWILPLEYPGKVWLPWSPGQEALATDVVTIFKDCVQYAAKTLYASCNVLSLHLEMYVNDFAKPDVKDHVLVVCHHVFSSLPWATFWPDVTSIKYMMKILNQGMPECIAFLGAIFIKIGWPAVVRHISEQESAGKVIVIMSYLLHLHISIGLESTVMKGEEMSRLLEAARTYPWHVVNSEMYGGAMRRFLTKCDPCCILLEGNVKEAEVLSILQTAAEFVPGAHPVNAEVDKKRVTYVRACIQLLCDCAVKNKVLLNSRMELFKDVILSLMNQTEAVLLTDAKQDNLLEKSAAIVTEIFNVLNIALIVCLQDIAIKAIQDWVKAHPRSPILGSYLYAVFRCLASLKYMAVLSEAMIEAYFNLEPDASLQGCGWAFIHSAIEVPELTQKALVTECLQGGHFLTLNGIAGHLQASCKTAENEWKVLVQIVEWLELIKPTEENEHKLLLLWWRILDCIERLSASQQYTVIVQLLTNFAASLYVLGEDKSSQGFFAAIGMGKKSSLSIRFRLVARALNSFVLLQISNLEFRIKLASLDSSQQGSNPSKQFLASITALEQTKASKQYAFLREHVQFAINFVIARQCLLKDYSQFLSYFTKELFADKFCLRMLITET